MFLHINVVPKAFIISVVFVYSNVFPTCDFFIYKLNRCKYVSFKKSVNLFNEGALQCNRPIWELFKGGFTFIHVFFFFFFYF